MKIKTKEMDYDQILALKPYVHKKPVKQLGILRWIIGVYTFFFFETGEIFR